MKCKKYIYITFSLCIMVFSFLITKSSCYAISDKFKFVIDTIGIPRYNIYGEEINEEIYYRYNVFSYSTPEDMYKYTSYQRFKEVPIYGKWSKDGVVGEYDYLGRGYEGQLISNVYFPVDGVPEVTPDLWNFVYIKGAWSSWQDASKFRYEEQIEYMKNSKLMFDTINYYENRCDPYNLVEYNITANSIGIQKVLLNTVATWKTYGVVTVNRKNNLGEVRYATLTVKPIAADAGVKSKFNNMSSNNKISQKQDSAVLNINFGANAINLTENAKPKHIKEIVSILYINDKEIGRISGSKTVSVDKNISFTVSRDMFPAPGENKIHIKVVSYLYTEFNVDGLMEDVLEEDLVINVDEKIIVPINEKDVYYQKKINDKLVVSPLVQTNITNEAKSGGVIEKQRMAAVNLKFNGDTVSFSNVYVKIDGNSVNSEILYKDNDNVIIGFQIPENINNTLYTWEYLRKELDNYFDVDFATIGNRIRDPVKINIEFEYNDKHYEEDLNIDVIDDYQKNINYIFDNGIYNKEELAKTYELEEV